MHNPIAFYYRFYEGINIYPGTVIFVVVLSLANIIVFSLRIEDLTHRSSFSTNSLSQSHRRKHEFSLRVSLTKLNIILIPHLSPIRRQGTSNVTSPRRQFFFTHLETESTVV